MISFKELLGYEIELILLRNLILSWCSRNCRGVMNWCMLGLLVWRVEVNILKSVAFFQNLLFRDLYCIYLNYLRCTAMLFKFIHDLIVIEGGAFLMLGLNEVLVPVIVRRRDSKIQWMLAVGIWTKLSLIVVIFWIWIHYFTFCILLPSYRWNMAVVTNHFKLVRGSLTWSNNTMTLWCHFYISFW